MLVGACTVSVVLAAGVQTLDTVEVIDAADNLLGTATSANQGVVTREQIEVRPNYRPGEILEATPGTSGTPAMVILASSRVCAIPDTSGCSMVSFSIVMSVPPSSTKVDNTRSGT